MKGFDEFYGIWNHPHWPEALKIKLASQLTARMDCAFDKVPKVYLDYETTYDPANGYGLRTMTHEQYIRDPRFQVILCSFYIPETGEVYWIPNYKGAVQKELEQLRLHECNVIAHNNPFDNFITADYYGIEPRELSCTMTMSRPLHGIKAANDLGRLAERYHLPAKGHEVENVQGMRLEDFTKEGLQRYGAYGLRDTILLAPLYGLFRMHYQEQDMIIISDTLRAGSVCQIQLDVPLLESYLPQLETIQKEKVEKIGAMLMAECGHMPDFPDVSDDEKMKKALGSSIQFGRILNGLGYPIPMKDSKTAKNEDGTPKRTPALAKNDMGFKELLRSDDDVLVALCEARLGEKATLGRTRATSLIGIGSRGRMPFPLKAFGAGTGRFTAYQSINVQNFPKRGGDLTLRRSMVAPPGFEFVTCDLSQIEARRMADHANQMDLLKQFEHNEDPYSQFASRLYGYEVSKSNGKKTERNVGKECIAEGSLVLTDVGLVPIEKITLTHRVWDGVNFVHHEGLIDQGIREVISYDGLTATPDHEVFCTDGTIRSLAEAARSGMAIVKAGDFTGPLWFSDHRVIARTERHGASVCPVSLRSDRRDPMGFVGEFETWQAEIIQAEREKRRPLATSIGSAVQSDAQSMYQREGPCVSTLRWPRYSAPDNTGRINYVGESSGDYAEGPERTGPSGQRRPLLSGQSSFIDATGTSSQQTEHVEGAVARADDTTIRMADSVCGNTDVQSNQSWHDWRGDSNRCCKFSLTEAESVAFAKRKARVFDIANAGPAKRYTVNGCLVLNCILSLQYKAWFESFWLRLRTAYDLDVSKDFCKDAVLLYRDTYKNIGNFWVECKDALQVMLDGGSYRFGYQRDYVAEKGKIILPDGWVMKYEGMEYTKDEKGNLLLDEMGRPQLTYIDREKRSRRSIYEGIVANNTTQGSSARILMYQMRDLREDGIFWAGQVHDELIFLVPSCDLEDWCARIEQGMRKRPAWASRTPIDCELTVGRNYADQYDLELWLAGGRTTLGAEAEKKRRKSAAMAA